MKCLAKRFLHLFLILSISYINAQQAQYETSFYFEDAIGNKDTIIVGADTSANGFENPHLGMVHILTPWDSVFEVRASIGKMYWDYFEGLTDSVLLFKKLISDALFVPSCGLVGNSVFFIHSLHHPVTITWDTLYWTQCHGDGSFLYNRDEILEPGWWSAPGFVPYSCLGLVQSYIVDTTSHFHLSGIIDTVQGIGQKFIYGVRLQSAELQHPLSPCSFVVKTPDIDNESSILSLFPNPGTTSLHISIPDKFVTYPSLKVTITNIQGLITYSQHGMIARDLEIDISAYPAGLYITSIYDPISNLKESKKFVVIR